eukprot:SAG31_NODE_45133_length_260_cov_0.639752_1_plen_39_part_10
MMSGISLDLRRAEQLSSQVSLLHSLLTRRRKSSLAFPPT